MNSGKSNSRGEEVDPLSVLVYRRCRRRCPICTEKERKMGLEDDIATTTCPECLELEKKQTMDGVLARRVIDLEATVAKQDKAMAKLKDSVYDLRHECQELKKAMNTFKNLPTVADIEAIKNLCALVAGESRDNLQNLKKSTEKKLKSSEVTLSQQGNEILTHRSAIEQLNRYHTMTIEKLGNLELTKPCDSSSEDIAEIRNQLNKMDQQVSILATSITRNEEEIKKKKPHMEAMKSELNQLKQTVLTEHSTAIRKLQKRDDDRAALDLAAMEESLRRALLKNEAKRGGPAYNEDLDKVKRHIRNVEKKVNSLSGEVREGWRRADANTKELATKTADAMQQIVDHINGSDMKKYIPSFPDNPVRGLTEPMYSLDEVLNTQNQFETTGQVDLPAPTGTNCLDSLSTSAPPQIGGNHHPYIDDPATFDRYVQTNFDMDRLLREDENVLSATTTAPLSNKSNVKS